METSKCCEQCNRLLTQDDLVTFDEFGYADGTKDYCKSCFLIYLVQGFQNFTPDKCEICDSTLEPFLDTEVIFDEGLIWYNCPNHFKETNVEIEHSQVGLYILQPPDDPDGPTWNG